MSSVWPAPAKLNLFLHVVGRRADGYHLLQTVFQLIDLCDTLTLAPRADGRIERIDPLPGLAAADDLCVRAALALQREAGARAGAAIRLEKRIPIGGGLGGGSSDAATVLVALNEIWETGLTTDDLAAIGARLGADVSVFIRGHSAWAEGIGEILQPIDLKARWFLVLAPYVAVATPQVFAAAELTRDTPLTTITRFVSGCPTRNDLEPVVRARHREVDSALRWLSGHAPSRMSGSGSSVFAALADEAQARRIASVCPEPWRAFVVRGLAQSPLRDAVAAYRARRVG
ncbi:MAG: 4-(cytidine 5'-diphospho)-2-C-methyl-D-erythritol kinase [Xanthomonadales bacterium]|nr:4-(cytidine 5'-diphospho)-2-C-methyl-D-erythritol kinase [Xanthomonadales bacterium]